MKRVRVLCLFFSIVLLSSCGKEDKEPEFVFVDHFVDVTVRNYLQTEVSVVVADTS